MTLPAEMLQCVGRGHTADTRTDFVRRLLSHSFEKSTAKRIADARRVDDPMRGYGRYVDTFWHFARQHCATVFAFGDDESLGAVQHLRLTHARFLPEQLELVVVAYDERCAGHPLGELIAGHARALLAGIP